MKTQQRLLAEYFQKLGGQVEFQRFRARDPQDGSWVPMANLLVHWHPKSTERVAFLPITTRSPIRSATRSTRGGRSSGPTTTPAGWPC